jgi:glycosyltransferase involved in cell wall biosynthesis
LYREARRLVQGRPEVKLDLGCGPRKKSLDFIGIDWLHFPQVDLAFDLENSSLPFDNNSVDLISARHILEHVRNYIPFMEEIWRVLKPEGRLEISVPDYSSRTAFTDPTHLRCFTQDSFDFFDRSKVLFRETGWYLSKARFEIESVQKSPRELHFNLIAKKLRILMVAPPASVHTRRWKKQLGEYSHSVAVAGKTKKGVGDFALAPIQGSPAERIEGMSGALGALLSSREADVVHLHYPSRYGHLIPEVPKSIRRIVSVWGEDVLTEAQTEPEAERRVRTALEYCDFITCTSRHMAAVIRELFAVPAEKIWVIPWGYDGNLCSSAAPLDFKRLRLLGLPEHGEVILSARVCRPQNNISLLIEAFAESGLEATLAVLTGELQDGDYSTALKKRWGHRRDIIFLPPLELEDFYTILRRAAFSVSIPAVDQLATTVLESLACGVPVLCSRIEPYLERILAGYNGWFADADDIAALKEGLRRALSAVRENSDYGENSRLSVRNDSWERNADLMVKIYDAPLLYFAER